MAISDPDSILGIFGKVFGESPGYGLVIISLSILLGGYIKDIKKQKIPGLILLSGSLLYLFVGLLLKEIKLITDGSIVSISLAFFLLITNKKDFRNYKLQEVLSSYINTTTHQPYFIRSNIQNFLGKSSLL